MALGKWAQGDAQRAKGAVRDARSKRIRTLIVDDSPLMRDSLARELSKDSELLVVATAPDPYEAHDCIMLHGPDVMVSDINMPKMSGIDFIVKLMAQHPIPIVVISSSSGFIEAARKVGAVSGVLKPSGPRNDFASFAAEVIRKVKAASARGMASPPPPPPRLPPLPPPPADGAAPGMPLAGRGAPSLIKKTNVSLIAIGASTGGTDAIAKVMCSLPAGLPGIVIVQHMPGDFTGMFADRLNAQCSFPVREARDKERIAPGVALVAPGGYQLKVTRSSEGLGVSVAPGEKVSGHCPSVDVMFESVARSAGANAVGVILTGMGSDGADGLLAMRAAGAQTIGQDKETSVVYGMPKAAYDKGSVQYQLPIEQIAKKVVSLL